MLSPYGPHGSPAIVHDFLYWDQRCTREESDRIFALAMKEQDVAPLTRTAIYKAVRWRGDRAWSTNAAEKRQGLPRVIPSKYLNNIPPKTSWKVFRHLLYSQGVLALPKDSKGVRPAYCDYGKSLPDSNR